MKALKIFAVLILMTLSFVGVTGVVAQSTYAAPENDCPKNSFFGIPPWYKYVDGTYEVDAATGANVCNLKIENLSDVWFIVAGVIEILLRVASLVAIGFVIYGGASYILSQGQPDKTKQALMTIINALVGLVITVVAAAVVGFVAGRF
jgi:Type IV secretion system pilin